MEQSIGFIGAGNMASSIIGGLVKSGYDADKIWISDPSVEQTAHLERLHHIQVSKDNIELVKAVDIIVLAVKPQVMNNICEEIANVCNKHTLFISIAAGIETTTISQWLNQTNAAIIRCMPNTPALLNYSATGIYANANVIDKQKDSAEQIMRSIGITQWVDSEILIDSITAVSGSGPAYFFLLMEAMMESGVKLGLTPAMSQALVKQTALGAAMMYDQNSISAKELRKNVTSPGGTTEQAIKSLQANGFETIVEQALTKAKERARELSIILSK
ncbi:MAG: pyrroline-5-carboxylate reductase [Gammaproteobacteria bacterium]|nr:pyrroline-5-carboxylate reductase [Gammaproteobacteria bacterium]